MKLKLVFIAVFVLAAVLTAYGQGSGGSGIGPPEDSKSEITPLKITKRVKPAFTDRAREMRLGGYLRLKVTFLSNGKIGNVTYIKADPPNAERENKLLQSGMIDQAIEAAKKIKFKPAMKNGIPISVLKTVQYDFN